MKAIVWNPSEKYQDRNRFIKYISKQECVQAVEEAQSALTEIDKNRPDTAPGMMSKAELADEYQRLVNLYNEWSLGGNAETEAPQTEEAVPSESEVEPKAEKEPKKKAEKEPSTKGREADAHERFDKYTKELAEKEALVKENKFSTPEEKKTCLKRIASLNRKIKRAEKTLKRCEINR